MGIGKTISRMTGEIRDCYICGKEIEGEYEFCFECYSLIKDRIDKHRKDDYDRRR